MIHELGEIPVGAVARCCRCGHSLYRPKKESLDRSLALTVAGAVLFIIANTHPFLGFKMGSQLRETILLTGVYQLYFQEMLAIGTLVLVTVVVVPCIHLICLLWILIPLRIGVRPPYLVEAFKLYLLLKPWGMLEIFLLGILVSGFKLATMATIIPGVALYAFLVLIFVLAAISVVLDEHLIWEHVEY